MLVLKGRIPAIKKTVASAFKESGKTPNMNVINPKNEEGKTKIYGLFDSDEKSAANRGVKVEFKKG